MPLKSPHYPVVFEAWRQAVIARNWTEARFCASAIADLAEEEGAPGPVVYRWRAAAAAQGSDKLTLTNARHKTSVRLLLGPYGHLSKRQLQVARSRLCRWRCEACARSVAGEIGPQVWADWTVSLYPDREGGAWVLVRRKYDP